MVFRIACVFVLAGATCATAAVAGQRCLFLDDFHIAGMEHLERTMHQPTKVGGVILPDTPWEAKQNQTRSMPAWDEDAGVYKLWVNAISGDPSFPAGPTYCESVDGINWTKPAMYQQEFQGSLENNLITVDPSLTWHASAILNVVHTPDDPDPNRRYKGFLGRANRRPIVSPDGIHWSALSVPSIPSSDESNMSYDASTGTYIATLKQGGPYGRAVTLSTSTNFENWTAPQMIFHADAEDQVRGVANIEARLADPTMQDPVYNDPAYYNVDVYNMGVFKYEDIYVGMPAMYHTTGPRPEGNTDGFRHIQLACSRNLTSWTRLGDRQPFIDTSPVGDAWDTLCMLPPSAPVVRGDELWFYYTGSKYRGTPPDPPPHRGAVCLALLRRDGFISLDAGEESGVLLSKPVTLTDQKLCVNVDADTGGFLQVEVLDANENVLALSEPVVGNHPSAELQWQTGDLGSLLGRTVSLRFTLRNASFYSYWGTEPGYVPPPPNLVANGDFEDTAGWGPAGSMSPPPCWTLIGGSPAAIQQAPGGDPISGLTSAFIPASATEKRYMAQAVDSAPEWTFDVDFASEDPGGTDQRNFTCYLYYGSCVDDLDGYIGIRVIDDGDDGLGDISVGANLPSWQWTTVLSDAVIFDDDVEHSPLVHHLQVVGRFDLDSPTYDITLTDADGVVRRVMSLEIYVGEGPATGDIMNLVQFRARGNYGDYLIDNVSVIPTICRIPGDADLDGKVTDADAAILATNWQLQEGATWGEGDFNEDGKVTDTDAAILATHWQEGVRDGTQPVPEPARSVLLLSALAMLLPFRNRLTRLS